MKKDRICISGYAGCGNLGDDAVLQGYLTGISKEKRDRLVVLTGSPRRDKRRFGVRCIHRKNPFAILYWILKSDIFLCGGGSLLQNATGNLSLFYYLILLKTAQLCGCKTGLMASGIGPIRGKNAQRITICVLKQCDEIELRDEASKKYLCRMGVNEERISVREDPAFQIKMPPPTRREYLLWEAGLKENESYFCMIVRQKQDDGGILLKKLETAIRLFSKESAVTPVYLSFDRKMDEKITRRFCQRTGGRQVKLREASDGISVISESKFVISMRLHPLIFSVMAQKKAIGISPSEEEPKLSAFCASRKLPCVLESQLTISNLLEWMEKNCE